MKDLLKAVILVVALAIVATIAICAGGEVGLNAEGAIVVHE